MRFAYLIEPPFNYIDTDGRLTGCDVELARHLVQELNLGPFEPVQTAFAQLLPGVRDGLWRMTTGVFATKERRKMACFSRPIWALGDGLLVGKGNPLGLGGYVSIARHATARLAVIRDQIQHRSAQAAGVPAHRTAIFETYEQAAFAVREGQADAYASVGRAHSGFIARHPDWPLEWVAVPPAEAPPAFGCFGFGHHDRAVQRDVDAVLAVYLGSSAHRQMVASFGFADAEVDLVAGPAP